MPIFALDNTLQFPSPELADTDGLLAMGGDLSVPRLLMAYRMGIFPWFEGSTPLWWSPDPRFVLYPDELRISKSMKQVFKKRDFDFTVGDRVAISPARECCDDPLGAGLVRGY